MVIYDQIGNLTFSIWSRGFYCSNLVMILVVLIWSTISIQFGHLPNGTNLVKSWGIPIWSPFVHRSSVLLQFGQLTLCVFGMDQFGHIPVNTNLVTLCTYIISTTPIWSADTLFFGTDQFGHILVNANLVTLCTYILSTTFTTSSELPNMVKNTIDRKCGSLLNTSLLNTYYVILASLASWASSRLSRKA